MKERSPDSRSMSSFSIHAVSEERASQSRLGEGSLSSSEKLNSQILRWLLHYPLQRTEDVALGVQALEQTIRRHLLALSEAGLVEQVMFSRFSWFYLTDQGIRSAAACE